MKSLFFIIMAAILAVLPLTACSSMPREVMLFDIDAFERRDTIVMNSEVEIGDDIRVLLGSNPSTGYNWGEPDISDGTIIELERESKYLAPNEERAGVSGLEEFMFKAREKGTCTVELEYSQPWEGGEKGTWKFTLCVTVE